MVSYFPSDGQRNVHLWLIGLSEVMTLLDRESSTIDPYQTLILKNVGDWFY